MNILFWKKNKQVPYPRSFAKRLTWRIMITLFIVMGITSAMIVMICWAIAIAGIMGICDRQLEYKAKSVEQSLTEVYVATINTVPDIEGNLHRPDYLQGLMKRIVELNPHIRSCGISFRENYYPQKGRWFCPYAQRRDSDSIVVAQTIGGQKQDYLDEAWFKEAMKAKKSYWSKPFFDGIDHKTPLVAYLVPIRDERDSTVAVFGVDMSLEWLARNVSKVFFENNDSTQEWSADEKIYYFITDSTGTFLVHPHAGHIIHQNFAENAKQTVDQTDDYLAQNMLNDQESGHFLQDDMGNNLIIDGEEVLVTYKPLEHTSWTMAMIFPIYFLKIATYIIGGLLLFFILIGIIVVFFAGRHGIKRASRPLKQLAVSADEVAKGHFDAPLPEVKSHDEIHQLRDSFGQMQHSLTKYINELRETTAQKASIESELKIAHDIQMDMIPKTFPPFPDRNDIDVYGSLTPAKAVGGDLFDFFILDDQLFFCIGDVSGKGVPASLFMAVTRSLFRNISAHVDAPEHIVYALNNALTEGNEANMFVTLFVGVLDLKSGQLRYCNAGHDAPLLVGRDVGELPCIPNLPIGVLSEFKFTEQEVSIDPQTTIFLFTDGLNEAEDIYQAQFGDIRIWNVAKRMLAEKRHQPKSLIDEMTESVQRFVGDAEQSDDLTMLAIQYKGR